MPVEFADKFNREGYQLSDLWYTHEQEVDNLLTAINDGKVSPWQIERICEDLDYRLNQFNSGHIDESKLDDYQKKSRRIIGATLPKVIEQFKPIRKAAKIKKDSGIIDAGDTIQ